jgi:hypothetical protein
MKVLSFAGLFALIACGPPPSDGSGADAAAAIDAGTSPSPDSGATQDSGAELEDTGVVVADAGAAMDAGVVDTGVVDAGSGPTDSGIQPRPDTGPQPPALEPNICSIYRSRMFAGCANGYCHGGGAGGFDLDHSSAQALHDSIVDVETAARMYYVLPENVRTSYLINKLQGTQDEVVQGEGERMPQGGPYFDRSQMDVLRRWIESGASDRCP